MRTQVHLMHLARDVKTALELAIAAFAPTDLVDRLALAAGYLDAFTTLDPDVNKQPLSLVVTMKGERQAAISEGAWSHWLREMMQPFALSPPRS